MNTKSLWRRLLGGTTTVLAGTAMLGGTVEAQWAIPSWALALVFRLLRRDG